MIRLQGRRAPCPPARAEQALAALDDREGIYFGVDAGIPGLHPQQATLATGLALRLRLYGDGVEVEALSPLGQALLGHEALAAWRRQARRGGGALALDLARGLLACFEPSPDVLLIGALPFEAWRLGTTAVERAATTPVGKLGSDSNFSLGVLYLPEHLLRRNAQGVWQSIRLTLSGATGTAAASVGNKAPALASSLALATEQPADDLPPGGYAAMVERALGVLRERPLVSLTLSQSYRRAVSMRPSQAFARLRAANPAPASFFLNDGSGLRLFGASPDLQLRVSQGEVQSLPVCGTVARRPGAQGEAESLRELFNEEVDAAALAVCSDALRNDLAPLCEPGSLRLLDRRRPMSLATVVHAVDRLGGKLRPGMDAWDAIAATAAPVMLTGTPRPEALRAIGDLEPSPRGWYGGMVVQVASNGDALAGTLLRAAAVRDGVAEVRTGGDLLADSSPQREEEESRLKTRSLWRAFGLEEAPALASVSRASGRSGLAVRLQAEGDPFADALADCLAGLGITVSPDATLSVLAGIGQAAPAGPRVWIGDAAYEAMRVAGATVESCTPEQGRAIEGVRGLDGRHFSAGRYARHRLVDEAPPEWVVHAVDTAGAPLALSHGAVGCILFRPESLLSDDTTRELLLALLESVAAA